MWDKAVACLFALNLFLIGLLQVKCSKHLAIFFNNARKFDFIDSNIVRFLGDNMDILSVDLNNIILDDIKLMKIILKLLFVSYIWVGVIALNKIKHLRKK